MMYVLVVARNSRAEQTIAVTRSTRTTRRRGCGACVVTDTCRRWGRRVDSAARDPIPGRPGPPVWFPSGHGGSRRVLDVRRHAAPAAAHNYVRLGHLRSGGTRLQP